MVSKGVITTVAGGGTGCTLKTDSLGDGCPATSARVDDPEAGTANFREVGQNHALTRTFRGLEASAQGKPPLAFVPVTGYAAVSALEVLDESK
ncbi:MAG: hypothetical protein ACLQKA_03105 [Bryobacteraceae bacterium]